MGALAVLAPVAAIVAAAALLLRGTVVADDDGVRVYGSGFLPFLRTGAAQVRSAEAREIAALDYGGWGLRVSGRGVGYIADSGPALVVRRRSGSDRIYSVGTLEDAQRMAALLNRRAGNCQ